MQLRPDPSVLLEAITQFLLSELLPTVNDKSMAFKVMIADSLTGTLSLEWKTDDARYAAEVERLQKLLPGVVEGDARQFATREARANAINKLNTALAEGLRANTFTTQQLQEIGAHVRATALETLQATNPRFDTSSEID